MLTVFICIFLTITSTFSVWILGRTFKEPHTFNLGITHFVFEHINKILKTSFYPDIYSFKWAMISILIHSPPFFLNQQLFKLIETDSLTKKQAGFILFSSAFIIVSFIWSRHKISSIFHKLYIAVINKDREKIIAWIKRYEKYPYFLKIAIKDYEKYSIFGEVYQSLTWQEDLQNELPKNSTPVKNKINKI